MDNNKVDNNSYRQHYISTHAHSFNALSVFQIIRYTL